MDNSLKENLEKSGNNINWLENNLKKQGISDIKKIFLATCDNQNNLSVYVKLDILSNKFFNISSTSG